MNIWDNPNDKLPEFSKTEPVPHSNYKDDFTAVCKFSLT